MNEFELIRRLQPGLPTNASTVVGAGDDCAVLDPGLDAVFLLFKTDAVVEGVHFTREDAPRRVGHKALARPLSDVAAMAGTPTHALVTLALPKDYPPGSVDELYEGINTLARRCGVAIVGGETTANPGGVLISVAVLGTVPKRRCVLRSGAKPGDAIFVTGELGGSRAGRHLDFEPRLREAGWLAGRFEIHAMIDLSDGLAGDLKHILNPGAVGAELHAASIPVSRAAREAARIASKPALLGALSDGEDFELLFTVASRDAVALHDAWKQEFPDQRLSCVGRITAEPGLRIRDRHGLKPLNVDGYVHFQQP